MTNPSQLPTPPSEAATYRVGNRLLFENDRVRIWELSLAPGERSERHRHQADHVSVYLTRSRLRMEGHRETSPIDAIAPTSAIETAEEGPGFTGYHALTGSFVHTVENVGHTEHREVLIELKGPNA